MGKVSCRVWQGIRSVLSSDTTAGLFRVWNSRWIPTSEESVPSLRQHQAAHQQNWSAEGGQPDRSLTQLHFQDTKMNRATQAERMRRKREGITERYPPNYTMRRETYCNIHTARNVQCTCGSTPDLTGSASPPAEIPVGDRLSQWERGRQSSS